MLASSTEEKTEAGGAGLTQQKKVQVDWSFVLGEAALDIRVGRYSRTSTNQQIDILVLGTESNPAEACEVFTADNRSVYKTLEWSLTKAAPYLVLSRSTRSVSGVSQRRRPSQKYVAFCRKGALHVLGVGMSFPSVCLGCCLVARAALFPGKHCTSSNTDTPRMVQTDHFSPSYLRRSVGRR